MSKRTELSLGSKTNVHFAGEFRREYVGRQTALKPGGNIASVRTCVAGYCGWSTRSSSCFDFTPVLAQQTQVDPLEEDDSFGPSIFRREDHAYV